MKRSLMLSVLSFFGTIFFLSTVYADVTFDYGASVRLRQEIWDNTVTLGTGTTQPDRNFLRLRTSLWGKANLSQDYGAYLKLTNEAKWYGFGPFKAYKTNPNRDNFDPDELVVDNLYFDANKILGSPISLRIGRQDFIGTYGEGFLLMDGTPGDGSRTFYFNAAKVNVAASQNFNFDLTYITNTTTDIYMPSIHPAVTGGLYINNKKLLNASHDQAFVLYGRGKIDKLTVEPYYIYKIEDGFTGSVGGSGKLKLNTIGARLLYNIDAWSMGGEFATQFGEYDNGGPDRTGNGGYIFVGRKYDAVMWKPEWELRYIYLSGDKAGSTDKVETWDPLFSRNPYWNELFIYTLVPETGRFGGPIPGYWTNLELLRAMVKMNFTPAANLALSYQYLWAPQKTAGLTSSMFSNEGHSRGHLPTALLGYKFSKNVDGYLQFEYFFPQNFYSDDARNAIFFRWQLQFKI